MIKKITVGIMLSLGFLCTTVAATFEESEAYTTASPICKKTYEILSKLEPVEIVISPNNPTIYNSLYSGVIISTFHNYITPRLALYLVREVEKHLEDVADFLQYKESEDVMESLRRVAEEDVWQRQMPNFPTYAISGAVGLREQLLTETLMHAHTEALKEMLKLRDNPELGVNADVHTLIVLKHYH